MVGTVSIKIKLTDSGRVVVACSVSHVNPGFIFPHAECTIYACHMKIFLYHHKKVDHASISRAILFGKARKIGTMMILVLKNAQTMCSLKEGDLGKDR